MKVILDQTACGLVCHPIGNLDSVSRDDFLNAIGQIRVGRPVIFALGCVPFIDSAGVRALVGAFRCIRQMGGDAAVCSARPSVRKVLDLIVLPRTLKSFGSLEEAEDYFSRRPHPQVARPSTGTSAVIYPVTGQLMTALYGRGTLRLKARAATNGRLEARAECGDDPLESFADRSRARCEDRGAVLRGA